MTTSPASPSIIRGEPSALDGRGRWQISHLPDRLARRVSASPSTGCWLWTGKVGVNGYGVFYVGHGQEALAHRVVYEALVGVIPEGLVLDHRCWVTSCVNPRHLRVVTLRQNTERTKGKGGTSRFLGVHRDERYRQPWRAEARVRGAKHYLGGYATEYEAALVAARKRVELGLFGADEYLAYLLDSETDEVGSEEALAARRKEADQ